MRNVAEASSLLDKAINVIDNADAMLGAALIELAGTPHYAKHHEALETLRTALNSVAHRAETLHLAVSEGEN